jgi:hypothetical protein
MRGHGRSLTHLEDFVDRALPAMLRRMWHWKGLHPGRHADVVQDLQQDLLLDCLENGETIAHLTPRERNGRWFRLVEQRHYQLRLRDGRQCDPSVAPDDLGTWSTRDDPATCLDGVGDPLARRLLGAATHLKNGRLNAGATAGRLGLHRRDITEAWTRVADALGYDERFLAFWRRRLVEALVGLAADLLRDRQAVRLCGEDRRARPDPLGRLARIRSIKGHLSVRPIPADLKQVLSEFTGRGIADRVDPKLALRAARSLQPRCPAVQLWSFEEAVVRGDHRAAAQSLWIARTVQAERARLVLARARLLEARGRGSAAAALLRRALARHRGDRRIRASLARLEPGEHP